MKYWKYIVLHTAAHGRGDVDYDTTAAQINEWHLANGWRGIGYHFVIRKDGTIEKGRALSMNGAHTSGLNSEAIGICFSGHGDIQPLTSKQLISIHDLLVDLMKKYNIHPDNVIGHREVNLLVEKGILEGCHKTTKTCPGTKVNMDIIRNSLKKHNIKEKKGETETEKWIIEDKTDSFTFEDFIKKLLTIFRISPRK